MPCLEPRQQAASEAAAPSAYQGKQGFHDSSMRSNVTEMRQDGVAASVDRRCARPSGVSADARVPGGRPQFPAHQPHPAHRWLTRLFMGWFSKHPKQPLVARLVDRGYGGCFADLRPETRRPKSHGSTQHARLLHRASSVPGVRDRSIPTRRRSLTSPERRHRRRLRADRTACQVHFQAKGFPYTLAGSARADRRKPPAAIARRLLRRRIRITSSHVPPLPRPARPAGCGDVTYISAATPGTSIRSRWRAWSGCSAATSVP